MYKATLKYKSFILAEYKELTLLTQKKKKRKKSLEEARSKHVRGGEGHWANEKEEEAKYL